MTLTAELHQIVETTALESHVISERTAQIHAAVLDASQYLGAGNFTKIHPTDLELLFAEYDRRFFGGQIQKSLGSSPLQFSLSQRMTSAGGQTACYYDGRTGVRRYQISVATSILFGCFRDDDHRAIITSGIKCQDRLDALQRVMEHELVHLLEMVLWQKSSCTQARFQAIAHRFFGHTEHTHRLITPKERAFAKFGITPGTRVRFQYDGVEHTGVVNSVRKRATVLVERASGQRYTDGKHYAKFYVPVQCLERVE